ncbi:hypothetical protein GQ53DRAFT_809496 [Thozetella sp. PMI_491]|nr:hypothetical protein GQ53DRAFT_809496 [Thozetella sp. PMI_491]
MAGSRSCCRREPSPKAPPDGPAALDRDMDGGPFRAGASRVVGSAYRGSRRNRTKRALADGRFLRVFVSWNPPRSRATLFSSGGMLHGVAPLLVTLRRGYLSSIM